MPSMSARQCCDVQEFNCDHSSLLCRSARANSPAHSVIRAGYRSTERGCRECSRAITETEWAATCHHYRCGRTLQIQLEAPGTYRLKVSAPAFTEVSETVEVSPGVEQVQSDIALGMLSARQESITVTADTKQGNSCFPIRRSRCLFGRNCWMRTPADLVTRSQFRVFR